MDDTIRGFAASTAGTSMTKRTGKIETRADQKNDASAKASRQMVDRLTEIKNEEEQIRQGGGAKAIESQHKKDRLTARERIAALIDPKDLFLRARPICRVRNVRGMGRRPGRRNNHGPRARIRPASDARSRTTPP